MSNLALEFGLVFRCHVLCLKKGQRSAEVKELPTCISILAKYNSLGRFGIMEQRSKESKSFTTVRESYSLEYIHRLKWDHLSQARSVDHHLASSCARTNFSPASFVYSLGMKADFGGGRSCRLFLLLAESYGIHMRE